MSGPKYRGGLCHSVLDAYVADAKHGARLLELVDPSHVETIRQCSKLSWVPASALDALNQGYHDIAGRSGYVDFWSKYTAGTVTDSLFASLFHGALRIFGRAPRGLTKWVSRAWEVTTRDYGRVEVDDSDERVHVRLLDLPVGHRQLTIALSMQASLIALIEMTDHVPAVSCCHEDLERDGCCEMVARWSVRQRANSISGSASG